MQNIRRTFRIVNKPHHHNFVKEILAKQGFVFEQEPFYENAYKLLEEPFPLGRSLPAIFGLIYIQDKSSMIPPLVLNPDSGMILDMCSSPGSKTSMLAQILGHNGLIVANEPNSSRLANLRRNLLTMNIAQVVTCCYNGENLKFEDHSFDYIMLDPPCSGWGTTDKNPNVLKLWKGEKVNPLIKLQQALLKEASRLLKAGGKVVYSTCTTNVQENEDQVRYAREELGLISTPVEEVPGFTYNSPAYSDISGVLCVNEKESDAQGFFISAFRQRDDVSNFSEIFNELELFKNKKTRILSDNELFEAGLDAKLLPNGSACAFNDAVHFVPKKSNLIASDIKWQGLYLGKMQAGRFKATKDIHEFFGAENNYIKDIHFESIEEVLALTNGQSLQTGLNGRFAHIYLEDMPLAIGTLKTGRLIL